MTNDLTRLMKALKKAWLKEDEWREMYFAQRRDTQLIIGQLTNKLSRIQKEIEKKDILLAKAGYPQERRYTPLKHEIIE